VTAEADLRLGELHIVLTALNYHVEEADAPYGGWLHCGVFVDVPGFMGRFDWSVMPHELARLADDFESLYRAVPLEREVAFRPLERAIRLAFTLQRTGQIAGSYAMQPYVQGDAELKGCFRMDQSYLPALVAVLRRFVSTATART